MFPCIARGVEKLSHDEPRSGRRDVGLRCFVGSFFFSSASPLMLPSAVSAGGARLASLEAQVTFSISWMLAFGANAANTFEECG